MANIGVAKFIGKLAEADSELSAFARENRMTRDEAYKSKSALDAMGKSMEEIRVNPRLRQEYRELRESAQQLKPPDMSEGLAQVREILGEYTKLKQIGGAALQWIGHYTLKYVAKPLEQIDQKMGGLNQTIAKNLPAWSEKVGQALSWIVRLGMTVIRGAGAASNAVKKVFDMLPGQVKIATGVLAAFGMFIRAGPIGKLISIFTVAFLLLEDFFTYLDGGQSLLEPIWAKLSEIWGLLKDNGVLDKLKKTFTEAMRSVQGALTKAVVKIEDFWNRLKENDAINHFKEAFSKAGTAIAKVFEAAEKIVSVLLGSANEAAGAVEPFIAWLISSAIPSAIGLISDVAGGVANLLSWFSQLDGAREIVLLIVAALASYKLAMVGVTIATKAGLVIEALSKAWAIGASVVGLFSSGMSIATAAQWAFNMAMSANPIALVIIAIVALIAIVVLLVKNWDTVEEFFANLWGNIKETFAGISAWFGEKFAQAKEAVIGAFASIGEWFLEKYQGIIDAFQSIPEFFSEKFKAAVDKIKEVFAPIVNWFKDKTEKIKGFFSGIGDKVKSALNGADTDETSGDDMPGHADGGVFSQEHVARFAEDNQPEAVIPLTKPNRAREVMGQIGGFLGGASPSIDAVEKLADSMYTFMKQATSMLTRFDATLNAGAVAAAGNTTSSIVYNNQQYDLHSDTKVYTSSDKPQEIAGAVDRTQQLIIRNKKDIEV